MAGPSEYNNNTAATGSAEDSCFNGVDDDHDGLTDCADPSCQANVPSCCVGTDSALCCGGGQMTGLPIADCSGSGPLSSCAAASDLVVFGSPEPEVRTFVEAGGNVPAFVPLGQDADSGAALSQTYDPRAGLLTLSAKIAVPVPTPDLGLDAVGVGLVDAGTTIYARVVPDVALLVTANRQRLELVVGDEALSSWPLPGDDASHEYTLVVHPDGHVVVSIDRSEKDPVPLSLTRPLRPIVWGRTYNPAPGDPAPARVEDLTVTSESCDMPDALTRSGATVVPAPTDPAPAWASSAVTVGAPHVLQFDYGTQTLTWMALSIDRQIYLAEPNGNGFTLLSNYGSPVLATLTGGWADDGVDDPVLRLNGTTLELWFTGYTGNVGTVARATYDDASGTFDPSTVQKVLDPATDARVTSFEQPALLEDGGILYAVVRERDAAGHRLALYKVEGGSPTHVRDLRSPSSTAFAFDADEVASPAVLQARGDYRVYFSGRRGTRWSIGLIVSDDLQHWREPTGGRVLGGSGAGFDAIGVSNPAPIVLDGESRLYYAGFDGSRTRIGVAAGPPPPP